MEAAIFSQGEAGVLKVPFVQDESFAVEKLEPSDRIIHQGPSISLKLNPLFNSGITFQASESSDLPFKCAEWNAETDKLVAEGKPRDEAKRIVLRRRFPLIVQIVDGVIYSPRLAVVCESLGKITFMKQQLIATSQVFLTPTPVQAKFEVGSVNVPTQVTAVQQQMQESGATFMTVDLTAMTQEKPLTRIPPPNWEPTPSQAPQPVAGTSHAAQESVPEPVPGPSRSAQAPAKRAKLEQARKVTLAEVLEAAQKIQSFFSNQVMDQFRVHGDKNSDRNDRATPDPNSLGYSFKQFQNKTGMFQTNTVKIGHYLFGKQRDHAQICLYKTRNLYCGHQVPISLREGPGVINNMILAMIEGMYELARKTHELDRAEAEKLTGNAKGEAILKGDADYMEKCNHIGKRY